jgi:phosphatidylinositol alpha-mannosyltransferase
MGIVLVEALGCGKPVVASDITGYNEVLHDGTDGLLVPPGQPQPLARAIVSVLANDDLRARLSGQAARRARDFSWPSIARQVLGLYQDVIKPSRLSAAASTEN